MKKSRKGFVVMLAMMLAAVAVPAFAAEPMTISGVWETNDTSGATYYYYFSPGDTSGKMVGVATGILNMAELPIHGTWEFLEKDGKQLFWVSGTQTMVNGNWVGTGAMPPQREYRFTTESGTQKMIYGVEGDAFHIWTKIGTKLTDLPEVGPLGHRDATGGRFWAQEGIVVK